MVSQASHTSILVYSLTKNSLQKQRVQVSLSKSLADAHGLKVNQVCILRQLKPIDLKKQVPLFMQRSDNSYSGTKATPTKQTISDYVLDKVEVTLKD